MVPLLVLRVACKLVDIKSALKIKRSLVKFANRLIYYQIDFCFIFSSTATMSERIQMDNDVIKGIALITL